MTDAEPGEAEFMDRERLGPDWSPELVTALARCRVFVPLYSRRYFESDNCGREWSAFARREVNQHARRGEPVYAVVPALWSKMAQDMSRFRSDYQRAVHRLAERIIEVADETDIKPDFDDRPGGSESLASAFGPASVRRPEYHQPLADYASELATKCLDCPPVVTSFRGLGRRLAGVPRQCQLAGAPAYPPAGPKIERPRLRNFDDSGGAG